MNPLNEKLSVIVRAIATDNLVCRNDARYPASELPNIAKHLIGKPASIDHPIYRGSVTDEWGTVIASEVQSVPPPLQLSAEDQAIVLSEGYHQVFVDIACSEDAIHLPYLLQSLRLRVSIAAMYSFMRCPGCTCGASLLSRECPNDFWSLPYFERHGVSDALEISLVAVPAVRSARVIAVNGVSV